MLIEPPIICDSVTGRTFPVRCAPDRLMARVGASYGLAQAATTLTGMIAGSMLGQRFGIVATISLGAALVAV